VSESEPGVKSLTRRALLGVGAATAGAAALEVASFRGGFDHRRLRVSAAERYAASLAALKSDAVIHVGHSTHLLFVGGARFLTDPWFYDPAFGALEHVTGPAVAPEHIGELDAILISHDHADHADMRAIDRLDKRAAFFAPTRDVAARARSLGFSRVEVLAPWQEGRVGAATVTAVPAEHDIYEIGYIVSAIHSVYFAGDTRLFDGVHAIAERFTPSLALLPVDGTRLTGGALHVMTPADAVEAAKILRCSAALPSHADARFSDPIAGHLLASTISGAGALFTRALADALPAVARPLPSAGDLTLIP
jgi:L-ascorbate metabolism protein UlaG (beta-lactamase superfamily)